MSWNATSDLIGTIPSGSTLLRIRFGWGFSGTSSSLANFATISNNAMVFGLCTVLPANTPPNPRTQPADVNPPLERWLWWESRVPAVTAWDGTDAVATWQDSPQSEPDDARGQVAAGTNGSGNLDLYASWAPGIGWDSSGVAYIWYYAVACYKTTL